LFTDALAALHRGIAAQSYLIDDLLAASQIIAGKVCLDMEQVVLGPVITAAVETAKAAGPLRQPAVHVAVDQSVGSMGSSSRPRVGGGAGCGFRISTSTAAPQLGGR
jgi:hypothetical protein